MNAKLEKLQERIGYRFEDPRILQQALTHRSHSTPHNERLEFLGDSILNFIVAGEVFSRFPGLKEGELSRLRSSLVREQRLFEHADAIQLGEYLRLGEGELRSGGHRRPSILADAFEALIGAIYLDGKFDKAQETVLRLYGDILNNLDLGTTADKDAKTQLQEWLQSRKHALPLYQVTATEGAAHEQRFEVECLIQEFQLRTVGNGSSRRLAEQEAAGRAYEILSQAGE